MQNKSFLITGATSGIGLACARRFAREGASKLLLTGRRQERLDLIKEELTTSSCSVETFVFDIRNRAQVENFVKSAGKSLSNLDVLVNNAGLAAGMEEFAQGDLDDWEQMIDTNVKGLLYMSRFVLPFLIARRQGHVINIGSIAGHHVYPKGAVYCASKFAVRALSDGMRIDLLGSGVRVTSIDPGMVETEFSLVRFKGDQSRASNVYHGVVPLTADDVAESVWWSLRQPAHVTVQDIILMPTDQASARDVLRRT